MVRRNVRRENAKKEMEVRKALGEIVVQPVKAIKNKPRPRAKEKAQKTQKEQKTASETTADKNPSKDGNSQDDDDSKDGGALEPVCEFKTVAREYKPLRGNHSIILVFFLLIAAPLAMHSLRGENVQAKMPVALPVRPNVDVPPVRRLGPEEMERRFRRVPYLGPYRK